MKYFAMNPNGYFFEIRFEHEPIKGFEYFSTREELYSRVSEVTGCDIDEFEGADLIVEREDDLVTVTDDRGGKDRFTIEDFEESLIDYEL